MLILVTYDVETMSSQGQKRLREVAKACQDYGQRVQNSVFECVVDFTQYTQLKLKLRSIMNEKFDSIRFYNLGNHYVSRVETLGMKLGQDLTGELIL